MKKEKIVIAVAIGILIIFTVIAWGYYKRKIITEGEIPTDNRQNGIETVETGLEVPWSIQISKDNEIFLTERLGRLRIFGDNVLENIRVPDVEQTGEGGLLGLALHPNFIQNRQIYIYKTTRKNGNLINVVERFRLENTQLNEKTVIVDDIPAASNHDGGRLAFGPDGYLYITTGDASQPNLAQDTNSLAGKILRVTENGQAAQENPFNNLVYSYGHRNSEGITWDDQGRLWATEHGASANDEINLIELGKNYGWPVIQGSQTREGMEGPVITSGNETWAPAGLAYYNGSLYFGGLRGSGLYSAKINNQKLTEPEKSFTNYGRIRAITVDNDKLYFSTSNRDGRGIPNSGDDKIIKIDK